MFVASVPFVRQCEEFTMRTTPIASLELMERAGTTLAARLLDDLSLSPATPLLVLCGPGNNGGDGLVVARWLALQQIPVCVVLAAENDKTSLDFANNLQRYRQLMPTYPCAQLMDFDAFASHCEEFEHGWLLDALFGIGLSRPLSGYFANVVDFFNRRHLRVIALDVPSGLFLDIHTPPAAPVLRAHYTYTFQWQKWAYLLPENADRVGQVHVLDIGLQVPGNLRFSTQMIDKQLINSFYQPPKIYAHKGTNGHGLLLAGSCSMPGAAILSATAALRAGIGKLTVHTTANVAQILPSTLPEAVLDVDLHEKSISRCLWENIPAIQALAIGPGIGRNAQTLSLLKDLLSEVHSPMIFDADALNILAENKTLLAYIPENSILTPHLKEFERLTSVAENDFVRIENLCAFAKKYHIIVVLKGRHTVVAMPDGNLFVNTTGNAGMATAGSGDVLTGVLLACMAKGYPPALAALLGVYLHGAAGDCALEYQSMESLVASDICHYLGQAFKNIIEND